MNQPRQYHPPPEKAEPENYDRGFPLAVVIILLCFALVIIGLVASYQKTAYASSARLVYMAARAKAIAFAAAGDYHMPVQADLLELIGEDINADAVIEVVDENRDATIDYIVYHKGGWATTYRPGQLEVEKEVINKGDDPHFTLDSGDF